MTFLGDYSRYQRLYAEHAAWKLLRADNAPLILAFFATLFKDENDVPFSRARIMLDAEISRCRELGLWDTETPAGTYLNMWIRSGWLRELDDHLSRTDACDIAVRFCRGLVERNTGTSASHLRIVQEAVRNLSVALNPNAEERIRSLELQKAELQREIDALGAGVVIMLDESEQRERVREIYQLSAILTGDFRRVEDEIRQLDKALRIEIIEEGSTRGEVLLSLMEKEAILAKTDAGAAFEGFYQLMCDQNRTTEFRDQLRSILKTPAAEQLSSQQKQFLGHLLRELSRESDQVFQVRRRTEEGLRSYIESGAAQEVKAVDKLLGKLEQTALALRDADCDLRSQTTLELPVGSINISSPDSVRLRFPDEKLDTENVEEHCNSSKLSDTMLGSLDTVQIREVAHRAQALLQRHGPMTVAGITQIAPIESGLEELVAYLRIAKSVGAAEINDKEQVILKDREGSQLSACIPALLLSADLFPSSVDELAI